MTVGNFQEICGAKILLGILLKHKNKTKKKKISEKDYNVWRSFTDNLRNIHDKDEEIINKKIVKKIKKIDLHGYSLEQANIKVVEFISESFVEGCRKLIIITGKGLRSTNESNPYISKEMSILRNSVPEFINNHSIKSIIEKIIPASSKDGGSGAIYIYLKKKTIFKG